MSKIISSASDVGALLDIHIDKIMETDAVIMEGEKTVLDAINQMQEKNSKNFLYPIQLLSLNRDSHLFLNFSLSFCYFIFDF